ncbi:MAG: O-antigen ligase family protein [Phycisphaerae bacterium]|nr:O-antigen ligase family protein [Phycisphaerae bacterium]
MSAESKPRVPSSTGTQLDNIYWRLALLLTGSVVVARFLTTESLRRWMGPVGAWAYEEPGPGPLTTLIFAGLLLLAFCLWLIGCVREGQIVRWPKWPVLGVLVMSVCTVIAAALAGQKQIGTLRAADWITQWLAFLMLLGLLRRAAYRRVLLGAVLAAAVLVSAKCVYQVHVELPEMLAEYQQDPEKLLSGLGIRPGTSRAAQIEDRIIQGQASGYFATGNVTASVLILAAMAAMGLGADRIFNVGRKFSRFFGLLLWGLAGLMVYAIVLTASRGAIVGLAVAGVLFAIYVGIKRFGRHKLSRASVGRYYRTIVRSVAVLVVVLVLAVVGWGLKFGSLGPRALTFRWHYWMGSAGMFAANPWFGVGPGNFRFHYLAHKLDRAVEEVANPHNAVVEMFTETGLLAGLGLVVCLAGIFILASKPAGGRISPAGTDSKDTCRLRPLLWLLLLAAGAFALRTAVNTEGLALMRIVQGRAVSEDLPALLLGLIAPLVLWAIGFAIAITDSDDLSGRKSPATPLLRIAIICGLTGFVLHNQITFAMLHGGGGTIFWVFAALALAMHRGRAAENYQLSRLDRYLVSGLTVVALAMFILKVFVPAASEHLHIRRAVKAYRDRPAPEIWYSLDFYGIEAELAGAVSALPSDPWPHTFWATILAERGHLERAISQQHRAVAKNPHDWTGHFDLAGLLAEQARRSEKQQGWASAIQAMHRALQCYPTKPQLHEELADMYAEQRNWPDAAEHYRQALDYDQAKELDAKFQWPIRHRREVQDKLTAARKRSPSL